MLNTVLDILAGVGVVLGITAVTGYFVAQEFSYVAADRARLRARSSAGDTSARRALSITGRTSFMLSGAQLGITVTGLVVGYVAEPMVGEGIGALLEVTGIHPVVALTAGTVVALLFATVVQMVFGELFPKNLAIARPEPVARRLALSTALYLRMFGWVVRVFDGASNALLRAVGIQPVHDVDQTATPGDLRAVIQASRTSGDLPPQLSTLLDRVVDFTDRPARAAMIPRPQVATAPADQTLDQLVARMACGHSRYPVVGEGVDDVVGVVHLRDILGIPAGDLSRLRAQDLARDPVLVPTTLPLPDVLQRLREAGDEFACVLDEYGGLAGVITMEDVAEELVGEITDEHDPTELPRAPAEDGRWTVPGAMHLAEVERLLDHDLPRGHYSTLSGLVMAELGRLPEPGDTVRLALPPRPDADQADGADDTPLRALQVSVLTVTRRVPDTVDLHWTDRPTGSATGSRPTPPRSAGAVGRTHPASATERRSPRRPS